MTQKEEVFNKLEIIKEEYGIEAIREYMRDHNGKARKTKPRINKRNDTAADIYLAMFGVENLENFIDNSLTMDVTRALSYVADRREILSTTAREHKRKFDAFANEMDYQKFSFLFNELYNKHYYRTDDYGDAEVLQDFTKHHFQDSKSLKYQSLDIKILIAFYLKYKHDILHNKDTYIPF
ncbi:MAG: hypothetical protein QM497_05275 [Sulfurimonas sp.]